METRPIKKEELEAATRVFMKAYPEGWAIERATGYLTKFWGFEPESCLGVFDDAGEMVGGIFGYSYFKHDYLVLYIQELFVDPDCRHQGYGKALVKALRDKHQKATVKIKPLVKADTPVLNFYNSLGFETNQAITFFDFE